MPYHTIDNVAFCTGGELALDIILPAPIGPGKRPTVGTHRSQSHRSTRRQGSQVGSRDASESAAPHPHRVNAFVAIILLEGFPCCWHVM